LQINCL